MKFVVERDVFEDAISWTARTLPARPAVAVLGGVWMSAKAGIVTLSSFDYEVSSRNQFEADVESEGEVLVSGKMVANICKQLPKKPVTVQMEGGKVSISCGASSFQLAVMPLDDYPALPPIPEAIGELDSVEFARAVAQVSRAASSDEALPLLATVRMELTDSHLNLMATDRYRLAVRVMDWQPKETDFSADALVKSRIISEMAKALSGAGEIHLGLENSSEGGAIIALEAGGRKITSQLTEGDYPPVTSLFPKDTPIKAVIRREELEQAIKRVALVTDRSAQIRMNFADGTLTLEAGQGNDAQAHEEMTCTFIADEPMMIVFDSQYLLDGLGALGTDYVRMSFTHPTKPAVITGQEELDGDDSSDFRYLLMPIRYSS
ncbi:DNA polymerase III subunit beta [uncultured Varibaculum sp.]|uniref:DNA polymerase III subunit beta n=1 Tax=uncultured Varibaculum sp. TaxID=413896 RepID=UPI0025950764|nr:DNA polymerase III subunit beta [uncultured Varibaculum sp.]